jgi:DNA-binding NarL/FixJ family response regulator
VSQLRVAVADDTYLLREALVQLLDADPSLSVVAVADDLASARAAVEEHTPDVLVCDVRMPPTNTDEGIQLAAELRESHPDLGVVVLSQYAQTGYAIGLVSQGARGRGYLLKENVADRGQLVTAVHTVAGGGTVMDPMIMDSILAVRSGSGGRASGLTERELQVLAEIASGASNRAIAERLTLSPRAVEKHITAIFAKLGVVGDTKVDQRVKVALMFLSGRTGER